MSDNKKVKEKRVEVEVSKTNFNRVKYGTHTLLTVLRQLGYQASESSVAIGGTNIGGVLQGAKLVSLDLVDLVVKPKLISVETLNSRKEARS